MEGMIIKDIGQRWKDESFMNKTNFNVLHSLKEWVAENRERIDGELSLEQRIVFNEQKRKLYKIVNRIEHAIAEDRRQRKYY